MIIDREHLRDGACAKLSTGQISRRRLF